MSAGRRLRRPAHGGRRRAAHRGRAVRRPSSPSCPAWRASSTLDALVEVHDEARARAGPRRRGRARRGEPARPGDLLRSTPAAPPVWRRPSPPDVVAVAESGIHGADDVARLADAGYQAVLVGEALVRAADRRAARARRSTGPPRRARRPAPSGRARDEADRRAREDLRDHVRGRRPAGRGPRAPTPSGSSSPRRRARSLPRRCGASSSACRPRSSPWGCSATRRPTRVVDIVNGIGLRAAQLHGDETAEDTRWVAERVAFTIKAFPGRAPQHRPHRRLRRGGRPRGRASRRGRARCSTGAWPKAWSTRRGSSCRAACTPATWPTPSPISAPSASTCPAGWSPSPAARTPARCGPSWQRRAGPRREESSRRRGRAPTTTTTAGELGGRPFDWQEDG